MNKSICKVNCEECFMKEKCNGCAETNGCPFGKQCFIAQYIKTGGEENFCKFKEKIADEFNELKIPGMPKVEKLHALVGSFVNLEYTFIGGKKVKILDDDSIYLGNQLECEFDSDRCYGVIAGLDFLLVCTYGENGKDAELVIYKKR